MMKLMVGMIHSHKSYHSLKKCVGNFECKTGFVMENMHTNPTMIVQQIFSNNMSSLLCHEHA
jgi:hypothetical protein